MKVSIVIPTYNRPVLLKRLLRSVVSQTFRDFEVIIVDDGSEDQDAYKSVIREFKPKIRNMRYFRTEVRRGAPHSRNRGIMAARHPLVALVDDDDEWYEKKLEKQTAVFRENDSADFCYTWAVAKDDGGKVLYRFKAEIRGWSLKDILKNNFIPSSSVLIKKECLVKSGLFDESLDSCQDWDMWIRIFAKGYRSMPVPEVLCVYHKHEITIGNHSKAYRGYQRIAIKHFFLFMRYSPLAFLKVLWALWKLRFRR